MNSFLDLFTVPRVIAFFLGVGVTYAYHWAVCIKKKTPFPSGAWRVLGIILGVAVISYSFAETQRVAANTKECQRQFNQALTVSRKISEENDVLSIEQRELFLDKDEDESEMWVKLVAPDDPEISKLPTNDPRRQKYGIDTVREYQKKSNVTEAKIRLSQRKQNELIRERRMNPLPEPTCGK